MPLIINNRDCVFTARCGLNRYVQYRLIVVFIDLLVDPPNFIIRKPKV